MSKLVNLSVSAAGWRFSVKLDEDTCNDAFEDIVLGLLGYDTEQEDTPNVLLEVNSGLNEPILHVEPKQEVPKEVRPAHADYISTEIQRLFVCRMRLLQAAARISCKTGDFHVSL